MIFKKTVVVGVDNGKSGAIVGIFSDNTIVFKTIMPLLNGEYDILTLSSMFSNLKEKYDLLVGVEQNHAKPFNGSISNFVGGYQYGIMLALLKSKHIKYKIVSVRGWQIALLKQFKARGTKEASAMYCTKYWPNEDWKRTKRCKKMHDGLTDAACIAAYTKIKSL